MVYYQLRITVCYESGVASVRRTALIPDRSRICQMVIDYRQKFGHQVFFHLNTIEPAKAHETGFQPIRAFNAFEFTKGTQPLKAAA